MSKRHLPIILGIVLLSLASLRAASAALEDLPGIQDAASLRDWLKLTDDQVAKLDPVITTRIEKVDAALLVVENAEEPDLLGFIEEYGKIRKEFDAGVAHILTPDQAKQWEAFKVELEKELVAAGAGRKLREMQPALHLTDEQVTKLQPAMGTALQGKVDVLQKLADGGRISPRDKMKAKRSMGNIDDELEKAMSTVMSPDQLEGYKALTAKKK